MLIKMHNKKLLKFIFIFNLFYTKYIFIFILLLFFSKLLYFINHFYKNINNGNKKLIG